VTTARRQEEAAAEDPCRTTLPNREPFFMSAIRHRGHDLVTLTRSHLTMGLTLTLLHQLMFGRRSGTASLQGQRRLPPPRHLVVIQPQHPLHPVVPAPAGHHQPQRRSMTRRQRLPVNVSRQ